MASFTSGLSGLEVLGLSPGEMLKSGKNSYFLLVAQLWNQIWAEITYFGQISAFFLISICRYFWTMFNWANIFMVDLSLDKVLPTKISKSEMLPIDDLMWNDPYVAMCVYVYSL